MSTALFEAILRDGEFRAIDRHIARWLADRSGDALIGLAALAASAAEGAGSACVDLRELAERPISIDHSSTWPNWDLWNTALQDSVWGAAMSEQSPLVLRDGVCWLRRNWQHEGRIAQAIRERITWQEPTDPSLLQADIDTLFGDAQADGHDGQRNAAGAAPGKRLFVMTGGPGTGKTTTVLRLLLLILRQFPQRTRIALAAPTGKAAQRLGESLRAGLLELRDRLPGEWTTALQHVPDADPVTLHRLLRYSARRDNYEFCMQQRLPLDILIVDEASMIDLAMMRRLFDALPESCMLVLIGDPDQLASVEAGSVLADIVATTAQDCAATRDGGTVAAAMRARVIRLARIWRASGALPDLAGAVRDGDAPRVRALFLDPTNRHAFALRHVDDARGLRIALRELVDPPSTAGVFDALLRAGDPVEALAALARVRIVSALRHGLFGQVEINRLIELLLRRRFGLRDSPWYAGRTIIVTENDYERGLYNGDVGIAHAVAGEPLRVWFSASGAPTTSLSIPAATPALRSFATGNLPNHETAYAMTVHKSQGSEFDHVIVVLPPQANRIVTRELLYTGLTRARQRADLWCSDVAVDAALQQRVRRAGGLAQRILEPDTAAD